MRYFGEIAYNGTNFHGWQKQSEGSTVQKAVEECLSTVYQQAVEVMGCGRTDAGVHASQFYFHCELDLGKEEEEKYVLNRMNKVIGPNIFFKRIFKVDDEMHARFDAKKRSYEYHLIQNKDPFRQKTAYQFPFFHELDFEKMQETAQLLKNYKAFFPFCKSNSDVKTMNCDILHSEWVKIDNSNMVFHISADRFLRGMVRLIVGSCINVGLKKVSLTAIKVALENQTRLDKSLSVPPDGLFLTEVVYEF